MVEWWSTLERQCVGHVAFVIGGPDGLAPEYYSKIGSITRLESINFHT